MAKYRVEMEDGRVYEMDAPEGTSKEVIYAAIQQRDPFAFKSTEALEAAPSAPFKAADIGRAAKAGIAGGLHNCIRYFRHCCWRGRRLPRPAGHRCDSHSLCHLSDIPK